LGINLKYEWDFDGDGTYDKTTTSNRATHIYNSGEYIPTVKVTDNDGAWQFSTVTIKIENKGPIPSSNPSFIKSGLTTSSYTPGTLSYSTTYYWKVVARNSAGSAFGPVWSFTTKSQPTYTVSGYVKDSSRNGISGVTISFSVGYSSVTTASMGTGQRVT